MNFTVIAALLLVLACLIGKVQSISTLDDNDKPAPELSLFAQICVFLVALPLFLVRMRAKQEWKNWKASPVGPRPLPYKFSQYLS